MRRSKLGTQCRQILNYWASSRTQVIFYQHEGDPLNGKAWETTDGL